MSFLKLLVVLPFLFQQEIALDETHIRFNEAMALAPVEGIPSLIRKLDAIRKAAPSSSFTPSVEETIQIIGLLHPGSVPDRTARLESLKASAADNPGLAKVLKRIDILQSYYASAAQGKPESASAALSDPVFEGTTYGIQAQADAALRMRDYGKAANLALQVIENDPYSPLLSNAYMVLGLSAAFRGDSKSALGYFRHALAASALPNLYGNPRDYAFTAYRFARPAAAPVGDVFDEVMSTHLTADLKDPQALIYTGKGYVLLDKEAILTITPEGKVLDKKPARKVEDITAAADGQIYAIADESIDLGSGTPTTLSMTVNKKPKRINKLRSVAAGIGGALYFVDQDLGLLRGSAAGAGGSLAVTQFAPIRGRLVRADRWGNIYVLASDQKSIQIFSREGNPLISVSPESVGGKSPYIEYFALDCLNHLYILDSNSIQIFAIINGSAGFEKQRVSLYALDQRPQFRNLRVLGVSATGEMALTGKNDDNWVWIR